MDAPFVSFLMGLIASFSSVGMAQPDELLTVAESSDYEATASYDEVMLLVSRIEAQAPHIAATDFGTSFEGRRLPLLVVADPPIRTPAEARASGKLVVFAMGNIHAGEVCGKEALLMLARELALNPDHPWLDEMVLLIAPIYNADGNERFSVENRPGQLGPARGMGQRPNAQGLDLNRDYIKLESPEARALVRLLTDWDPHLTIDTHTTNGSRHRYVLTFDAPLNPSGFKPSIEFVRDELLPQVSQRLRDRTGYATFFYGNFDEKHSTWATYSPLPRFGASYQGLRGQMTILSEAYSYAPYRDRVLATLEFTREIIDFAEEHAVRIRELHRRARSETIDAGVAPQPDDVIGIRHTIAAWPTPVTVAGFAADSDEPVDYQVAHLGRFEPTKSVSRPFGYLLPPEASAIVDKLREHGVEVEPFDGDAEVEIYRIDSIERAERAFEGHRLVRLDTTARREARHYPSGSVWVPTAQPLGTLVVYLLEPESEDGLAAWNFFDQLIEIGADYPVARVTGPDAFETARSPAR
ncbi:MAG: M14 family metallopeptidase [Phycisphaerales bacterium]